MAATYSSQANTGYLGTFSFGSPLVPMVEVKHINFPRYTIPKVNRTHLLSPNATEEYVPGIMDPGVVDVQGNFIGDPTQASSLDTLAQNQTVFSWQWTAKVQNGAKTVTVAGSGFMTKNDLGPVEANRVMDYSLSIQTTGFSTVSVA